MKKVRALNCDRDFDFKKFIQLFKNERYVKKEEEKRRDTHFYMSLVGCPVSHGNRLQHVPSLRLCNERCEKSAFAIVSFQYFE